jgi:O-antigen/teichoic acid export membrane protein
MPLLAKEYGTNNWDWINKIYSSILVIISVIGGATWIGGILFFKDFITLWTGAANYAGLFTVIAFGGYAYLLSMVTLNSGIVNTFNYTSISPFLAWGEALIKITFSILMVKVWGIAGVAVGTFLGSFLIPTWILPIWIRKRSSGKLFYDFAFIKKQFILVILPCLIISILLQVFVAKLLILRLTGIIIFLSYFLLTYFVMPLGYRTFFFRNVNQILKRIGIKSSVIDLVSD